MYEKMLDVGWILDMWSIMEKGKLIQELIRNIHESN